MHSKRYSSVALNDSPSLAQGGIPLSPCTMLPFSLPARHKSWGEIPLGPWGPAQCAACNWEPLKVLGEMCLGSQADQDEGSPHSEGLQLLVLPLNVFGGLD